ncbi:hypothetical protein VNO78_35217 [Psophocarpus tetragonolobus]|uniref:Uncharacterized protein n=1 Tax=Psophocarpus tetragonolobus TaxID=3891 RepID=A0AAN9RLS4_PSOTE
MISLTSPIEKDNKILLNCFTADSIQNSEIDQLPSQSDACLALSNSPVSQASQADHLVQGFQSEYFQQNVCLDRASNHLDPMIHLQVILCESARQGEKDSQCKCLSDHLCLCKERAPLRESSIIGKVRHKKPELPERSSKRMAVPIRDVTAGQKAASSILRAASKGEKACFSELGHMSGKESEVYDAEPTSLTDYSATARGDSARLANSILVRYGSCWVSPSLLNFPRSSARAV